METTLAIFLMQMHEFKELLLLPQVNYKLGRRWRQMIRLFLIPLFFCVETSGRLRKGQQSALAELKSTHCPASRWHQKGRLSPPLCPALLLLCCCSSGSDTCYPLTALLQLPVASKSPNLLIIMYSDTFSLLTINKSALFAIIALVQMMLHNTTSSAAAILLTYYFLWMCLF